MNVILVIGGGASAVAAALEVQRQGGRVMLLQPPGDDSVPVRIPGIGEVSGLKTTVLLEVEGAAHYLPAYAGNLDIMTSAALATAERVAAALIKEAA